MKKILVLLLITLQSLISFAQMYLDKDFVKTNKTNATYYQYRDSTVSGITQRTYYMNDTLYKITHFSGFENRNKYGKGYEYYTSGNLKYEMFYVNDKLQDELKGYYNNGKIKRIEHYTHDSLIDSKCYTQQGKDTSYSIYNKNARFQHGDLMMFRNFVTFQLVYPQKCAQEHLEGRVYIEFSVNSMGNVVDIKVLSSPHELFSESAIAAISKSPKWEPAIFEGEKVKQKFTIPITYKLQ